MPLEPAVRARVTQVGVIFTMLQTDQVLPAFEKAVSILQQNQGIPQKVTTLLSEKLANQVPARTLAPTRARHPRLLSRGPTPSTPVPAAAAPQ